MAANKLLVPVDGSSHSRRAAEYAIKMARHLDMEILLIHCHKPFPVLLGEPYYQKALNKITDNASELMEQFGRMLSEAQVPHTVTIVEGDAGTNICKLADYEQCEMIIMGSRGLTDLKGLFLGSVAHRVLHSAPCPVLVVRP